MNGSKMARAGGHTLLPTCTTSTATVGNDRRGMYKKEFVVDLESGLLMEVENMKMTADIGQGNTFFQAQENVTGVHIPAIAMNQSKSQESIGIYSTSYLLDRATPPPPPVAVINTVATISGKKKKKKKRKTTGSKKEKVEKTKKEKVEKKKKEAKKKKKEKVEEEEDDSSSSSSENSDSSDEEPKKRRCCRGGCCKCCCIIQ